MNLVPPTQNGGERSDTVCNSCASIGTFVQRCYMSLQPNVCWEEESGRKTLFAAPIVAHATTSLLWTACIFNITMNEPQFLIVPQSAKATSSPIFI